MHATASMNLQQDNDSCPTLDSTLLAPVSDMPANPPAVRVKIYVLGRFSILIGDEKLSFARKAPKRPLELLKILIALGGRNVREDVVAYALWPEAEADAAARALTSTLHRLRKLIGEQTVLRQEGQLTLDPRRCWVDVWSLEKRLNQLRATAVQGSEKEVMRRSQELMALQSGAFLPGEAEQPWLLETRSRLDQRFLRLLETFGARHSSGGRYQLALDCCERALEFDPHNERRYRDLMRVHLAAREVSRALSVYERCRQMLRAHYGCGPSPDTEALVREAKRS